MSQFVVGLVAFVQPGGLRVGGCLVCRFPRWKTLAALAAWSLGDLAAVDGGFSMCPHGLLAGSQGNSGNDFNMIPTTASLTIFFDIYVIEF